MQVPVRFKNYGRSPALIIKDANRLKMRTTRSSEKAKYGKLTPIFRVYL
jgi:hypothetical protein